MHNIDVNEDPKGRELFKASAPVKASERFIEHHQNGSASVLTQRSICTQDLGLILLDPEDRVPTDEVIKYHETRYRAIVENSMDNIYICDADSGRVIESNGSMQRLLGYSRGEMERMTVFDFLDHPKDDVKAFIQRIFEKGTLKIKDRRYRRKDGSLVDIEATCCAIDEGGRRLLCVVSRDMREIKEYEKKLVEERNRAELYLDILGHDIGNLHHGIMGFVGLCKQFEGDPEKLGCYINSIDSLTMRSVHLVQNLNYLSSIASQPEELVEIDPGAVISSCIETVRGSIPWKAPVFEVDMPSDITVMADPNIEHAFYNILHNAVKYQDPQMPLIKITSRETGDGYLLIRVRDFGRGIPPSMQREVLNRTDLKKKHGGLGLSVVRALVDRSAGNVWIEDPNDGKGGVIVVIELPVYI
ncbi:MAG: PAS domain-containing sensor histidine kinase [Candidatus Thermoplasmatota archaeon]|nr:PAS domain-containing sensor histidine kinase [Candidatus Thermoplasmatota archaeon]